MAVEGRYINIWIQYNTIQWKRADVLKVRVFRYRLLLIIIRTNWYKVSRVIFTTKWVRYLHRVWKVRELVYEFKEEAHWWQHTKRTRSELSTFKWIGRWHYWWQQLIRNPMIKRLVGYKIQRLSRDLWWWWWWVKRLVLRVCTEIKRLWCEFKVISFFWFVGEVGADFSSNKNGYGRGIWSIPAREN